MATISYLLPALRKLTPNHIRLFSTKLENIIISDSCVKQLKKLQKDPDCAKYLRVAVDGGGCSGFQYKFELDNNISKEDIVIEKEGVSVVIDNISLGFIKGSTLEYHEELIKSAFRIINNPLAQEGCSCGASFAVK